jgi:hypothetical protein
MLNFSFHSTYTEFFFTNKRKAIKHARVYLQSTDYKKQIFAVH